MPLSAERKQSTVASTTDTLPAAGLADAACVNGARGARKDCALLGCMTPMRHGYYAAT